MPNSRPGGAARKLITRFLATGALLGLYTFSVIGTTGVMLASSTSSAMAQRGRGRGRGVPARGRGRGRGNVGAGIAAGVAIGVIGGAIAADAARRRAADEDAVEYCMSRFRTYNPNTGTYIAKGGVERPCP